MSSTTEAQRAARRREVAKRLRLGESFSEIADAVGVSKSTVGRDVKRLREQWREEMQKDMSAHLSRRLAELKAIKREAFESWLESKEGPTREKVCTEGEGQSVTSVGEDGELNTEVAVTDVEEVKKTIVRTAAGDPRHLKVMLRAEERIAQILGVAEHSPSDDGSRIENLAGAIEETAEEMDMRQFEDEEIR
jgi:transposase